MSSQKPRRILAIALPVLLLVAGLVLVLSQTSRPLLLLRVLVPWAEVGALAIVMTAIILTGGIDLSVGSIAALSGVVLGALYQEAGWSIGAAVFGAIVAGTGAGAFNGTLVVAGLSPLVATLATMAFFRGLAMLISDTQRVTGFPESFCELSQLGGVSTQFWLLGVVALSGFVVVHATIFGRWCFAVGDNRTAARFAAVPDRRVDFALYTASGLVASLVAVATCMQHDSAVPDAFRGVELQVIACVVVGGTLITGGRGGVLQTLLGLGVIALLDIGLNLLSSRVSFLTAESRLIATGLLLIGLAVWNERLQKE